MLKLRDYQERAVDKILWAMKMSGNDIVVLPTGAGKSIVIAEVARRLDQEILILQPSKEILEQNVEKLSLYVPPNEIGVYSASCKSKRTSKYTFATIGSIVRLHERFKHIKLVLIDECHLVNQKKGSSMYNSFLKKIGNPKVIGFTATPYRNFTAYHRIQTPYGEKLEAAITLKLLNRLTPFFWSRLLVNVNVGELIEQNYLSPLRYEHATILSQEEMKLNAQRTDFDLDDFETKLGSRERQIIERIKQATREHHSILVFCSSVKQAEKFATTIAGAYCVSAKTEARRREAIIDHFKKGNIKVVFNVGVLTTGFDHPALDCIVLIRPTRSLSLFYQMLGRGVRRAPNKTSCQVIDYSDTVRKLGRIETIRLVKDTAPGSKWELLTETGSWHNAPLYRYIMELPKRGKSGAHTPSKTIAEPSEPREIVVVKKAPKVTFEPGNLFDGF